MCVCISSSSIASQRMCLEYNAKMQIDYQRIHIHSFIHLFNAILLLEVVGKGNGNEFGERERERVFNVCRPLNACNIHTDRNTHIGQCIAWNRQHIHYADSFK